MAHKTPFQLLQCGLPGRDEAVIHFFLARIENSAQHSHMLEVPSYRESLESSLTLRERLSTAETQQKVLYVIYDALHDIENFDEMPTLEAKINLDSLDNSLKEIRDAVKEVFDNNVLPKQYAEWFEGAKREADLEMGELAGILEVIQTAPLKNEDEYMQMLAGIHHARAGHSEYRLSTPERPRDPIEKHPVPIPAASFEPWRQNEIQTLTEQMTAVAFQLQKIEEQAPVAAAAS